jgi:hypothetical protein
MLTSGTSGTSSSVRCGDSAFGMVTAAALTQRLLRASSFRKRLRRFRARRSARLTAAGRRRSMDREAVCRFLRPPWAFRLLCAKVRRWTGIVFCFGLGRGGLGRTFRRAPNSPNFMPHGDARRAGPPRI